MKNAAIGSALLAAALYALNAPVSKLLLQHVAPSMMAALLYLGAGLGMGAMAGCRRLSGRPSAGQHLAHRDWPYILGMIVLDVLAPIFLMIGISRTTAANASLLNNFEIVATSLIALLIFKEKISRRLWGAIGLIVLASALLTAEDAGSLQFSMGSVFVLLASCCWGLENNCTRMLSRSDPQEIVIVKGLGSGLGALIVALLSGEAFPALRYVPAALLLGFVAYGLSIYFCVRPAVFGRRPDKRLLCRCAVHRRAALAGDIPRLARLAFLRCPGGDDRRHRPGHPRPGKQSITPMRLPYRSRFLIDTARDSWDNEIQQIADGSAYDEKDPACVAVSAAHLSDPARLCCRP